MIIIDGVSYNAEWVASSLEQTADIINGDNSGRLQSDKSMYLDYVGTFFNHTGQIRRRNECTAEEWDDLYLRLANPVNDHSIQLPFGQGILLTRVYISQIKRKFIRYNGDTRIWGKTYDVTLTAMESQWLAGGEIEGVR